MEAPRPMATNAYLKWTYDKERKKEYVSFVNFVKKFDITDKESANRAYFSLISSSNIRGSRRKRVHEKYEEFRQRNVNAFWGQRALKAADRKLLVNSVIIAKETAVMNQRAGVKETSSEFRRYHSELKANDDSGHGETKADGEACSIGMAVIAISSINRHVHSVVFLKMIDDDESESGAEAEISSADMYKQLCLFVLSQS
ncbi:hypothetical protein BGZ51_005376 [Haplosporangium sp. Z 767]|nr:hypothetical protein BGZ51_005376 [Haplosporangium sp. Z 767]KAF9181807.1 hypothetical protein BGZ50_005305 [Haplosporangium sp. Z 11]